MTWELTWKGDTVKARTRDQVADALNKTAALAVQIAQQKAPRRTGFMANTIQVVDEAKPNQLEVTWGNVTANYTLWQEIGSRGRVGKYFLRNAADQAYPKLKGFIRRND